MNSDSFLKSDYLFILLESLGYCLPKFQRENEMLEESNLSAVDFVQSNYSEAMEDVKVCWDNLTFSAKKDIINLAIERIEKEVDDLLNVRRNAIALGIEINKQYRKESA